MQCVSAACCLCLKGGVSGYSYLYLFLVVYILFVHKSGYTLNYEFELAFKDFTAELC